MTAPSAPTALVKTNSTQTSLTVSWTASTDNVGVAGYTVYVNGAASSAAAGTSRTISGLACGTTYTIGVDAYDSAGNHSAQTEHDDGDQRVPRRHDAALDAHEPPPKRLDGDVGDRLLDRVDRQRRRHRLRRLQERHPGRHTDHDQLHLHRPHLRHQLHPRRRRVRRSRQPLRPNQHHTQHQRLPRHDPADHTDRPRHEWDRPDLDHAVLDGLERQRGRDRLSALPGRYPGGDLALDQLPLQRARLRDVVHARRRRRRCRRERLRHRDDQRDGCCCSGSGGGKFSGTFDCYGSTPNCTGLSPKTCTTTISAASLQTALNSASAAR